MAIGLRLAGAGLGMGLHIALARTMSLEGLGVLVLALTIGTLVSVFASMGMPFCAIRFLPRYDARPGDRLAAFFERMSLGLLGVGLALAVALAAGLLALGVLPEDLARGVAGAIPLAITLGVAQVLHALLVARGRIVWADTLQSIARPALCILVVLGFAWRGEVSATLGIGILACVGVLIAILLAWAVPRTPVSAPLRLQSPRARRLLRHWVRTGLVIVLSATAVAMLERIDILIIGILLGSEEVAIYATASRLALVGAIVIGAANAAFGPQLSVAVSSGDRETARSLAFKAALLPTVALTVFLGGALVLGEWVLGFFGPAFVAGWPVLCILAGAQLMLATFGATGGIAIFARGERVVIKAVMTGLVADVALNLALVPVLGGVGAAIGSLIAMGLIFVWLAVWCKRTLGYGSGLWP